MSKPFTNRTGGSHKPERSIPPASVRPSASSFPAAGNGIGLRGHASRAPADPEAAYLDSLEELILAEERLRAIVREELQAVLRETQREPSVLLTARETAAILRVDERTLRRLVLEGSVPQPVHIGRRAIRWHAETLYRSLGLDGPPSR